MLFTDQGFAYMYELHLNDAFPWFQLYQKRASAGQIIHQVLIPKHGWRRPLNTETTTFHEATVTQGSTRVRSRARIVDGDLLIAHDRGDGAWFPSVEVESWLVPLLIETMVCNGLVLTGDDLLLLQPANGEQSLAETLLGARA